jgi:hypothetical protein
MGAQPNESQREQKLTPVTPAVWRRQMRGGQKGGLPVWEWKSPPSNSGITLASASGNDSSDEAPVEQLKHFNAQVAMVRQSSMALSQGLAAGGQQSCIGSVPDISVATGDFDLKAAAPAAGRSATDAAIRRANMVRANAICCGNIRPRAVEGQVTISRGCGPGKSPWMG